MTTLIVHDPAMCCSTEGAEIASVRDRLATRYAVVPMQA